MPCNFTRSQVLEPISSKNDSFDVNKLLIGAALEDGAGWQPDSTLHWSISECNLEKLLETMSNVRRSCVEVKREQPVSNRIPAGFTYLGQMVTHEIVRDSTGVNRHKFSPLLNLESLYWGDFWETSFNEKGMFDGKFVFTSLGSKIEFDLSRLGDKANIPESRNDENKIISQLHMVWQKLHNEAFDAAIQSGESIEEAYFHAKNFVTLVFQHVVVEDYLNRILYPDIYRLYFTKSNEIDLIYKRSESIFDYVPLEFSSAIFRFGHSMVRQRYKLNNVDKEKETEIGALFGRKPLESKFEIEWDRFFDEVVEGQKEAQKASKIDLKIVEGLHHIPRDIDFNQFKQRVANGEIPSLQVNGHNLDKRTYPILQRAAVEGESVIVDALASSAFAANPDRGGASTNIILADLKASAQVPTAADLLRVLYETEIGGLPFANYFGLPGVVETLMANLDMVNGFEVTSVSKMVRSLIGGGGIPLWIASLHETSVLPFKPSIYIDNASRGIERAPHADGDKMGPFSSIVIAEVIRESIRKSSLHIRSEYSNKKFYLGNRLIDAYTNVIGSGNTFSMSRAIQLSKNFNI